jgi:NAD(P)-dependent dehydrogenase (short-subunit alcohol dehydrogenase family)
MNTGPSNGSGGVARPERPIALVTGAGSGLGRALATSLASTGWGLVLVGRRAERLAETAAGLPADGAVAISADISAPDTAECVVRAALDRFGRIDALVNNAGVARFDLLTEADPGDIELMVRTNFTGPLTLIRHAAPELARRNGTIVNIGSIGGVMALPRRATYGATKAALHHLTRSLARELAPHVRVNAVAPGAIDTEMYDDLGWGAGEVAQLRAEMIRTTPLGRLGTVEDVVPWIQLLLGPAGAWVTGSIVVIDGGRAC